MRPNGRRSVDREPASDAGATLVVFPELALTTFFPRYFMEDRAELDSYFERRMPNEATAPLFAEAKKRGWDFYLGYAELVEEKGNTRRFNASILVETDGSIVGKDRKVHFPGHADWPSSPSRASLEKFSNIFKRLPTAPEPLLLERSPPHDTSTPSIP